ncbi:UPF0542 protein C5orf43-like [Tropilaelaps mercedesae]|uniref:Small integral membrane protein 15 n=1 Tax=Tropilaelaps mercedesae TaxID=418985 RepID=A0A1V9XMJ1_9ACAR|nr:UPF0542 protein C5orf43-like [Tropilaelaps mercedesae]
MTEQTVQKIPISPFPWYLTWLQPLVEYASHNPWEFLKYVMLILSPFLCLSALLSWKLAKQLEKEERFKKAHAKRTNAIKQRKNK